MSGVKNTINTGAIAGAMKTELRQTMLLLSLEIEAAMKRHLRDDGGIASGLLIGSIQGRIRNSSDDVIRAETGTPVEHAIYYALGTRAHWPPLEPIRKWVEMKIQPHVLAVGVEFSSGRALPTRKGTKVLRGAKREAEIMRVARAIQYAISKHGTRAHPFMEEALRDVGAPYTRADEGGDLVYQIDVAKWLESRGDELWARIAARVGGTGGKPS
jgi:hypothetical protein